MDYIKKILATIDDAIAGFQNDIPSIQKKLLDELQPLLKELEIKDGKLLNNVKNLKLIGDVKNRLEKIILTGQYKDAVNTFIQSFDQVSSLQQNYFAQFNQKYTPKKTLPLIKQLTIESTINNLVGRGMLENIIEPIRVILMDNITSGGSYAKFQDQLRTAILNDSTSDGSMVRYTKQITTDAINQYSAQYHETIAQDLQFNWGTYLGTNLTTSREFCLLLTKKEWVHKSELPEIIKGYIDGHKCKLSKTSGLPLGMIAGTNADNFKVVRGGYNCGHHFFWVPDSSVPDHIRSKFS